MSNINSENLLQYMRDMTTPMTKRELAKAFNLKGSERIALKEAIRDLMDARKIEKTAQKTYVIAGGDDIPAVAVFQVDDVTLDGEVMACPMGNPHLENNSLTQFQSIFVGKNHVGSVTVSW